VASCEVNELMTDATEETAGSPAADSDTVGKGEIEGTPAPTLVGN